MIFLFLVLYFFLCSFCNFVAWSHSGLQKWVECWWVGQEGSPSGTATAPVAARRRSFHVGAFYCSFEWNMDRTYSLRKTSFALPAKWFYSVGTIVCMIIVFLIPLVLVRDAYAKMRNMLITDGASHVDPLIVLQPILPGINTGWEMTPYLLLSVVSAVFVHEAGHAFASLFEGVPLLGVGVTFLAGIPMAHVRVNERILERRKLTAKWRILLAGGWHNIILTCFAIVLAQSSAHLFCITHSYGQGLILIKADERSLQSLEGNSIRAELSSLPPFALVVGANGRPLKDERDWIESLNTLWDQRGKNVACDPSLSSLENTCRLSNSLASEVNVKQCRIKWDQHAETPFKGSIELNVSGANSLVCWDILDQQMQTIQCICESIDIRLLHAGTSASPFVPKPWVRNILGDAISVSLPLIVRQAFILIASLSAGLALINLTACPYLDGSHVLRSTLNAVMSNRWIRMIEFSSMALLLVALFRFPQ